MLVKIKQTSFEDLNQAKFKSAYGPYTLDPLSSRVYVIPRGINGKYKTGLTEERKSELEKILNKDLSDISDFWKDFTVKYKFPNGEMVLNTDNPKDEITLAAAKANDLLAPDQETLFEEYKYKEKGIVFYIHDANQIEKTQTNLNIIKDEIAVLMQKMKNNGDKMFYIILKLGMLAKEQMSESSLYNMLIRYREKLTKIEKLREFKDVLELPNEALQATYFVQQGKKLDIIVMDVEHGKYKFLDKFVGKDMFAVTKYFSDKKNEADLISLMNEVKLEKV